MNKATESDSENAFSTCFWFDFASRFEDMLPQTIQSRSELRKTVELSCKQIRVLYDRGKGGAAVLFLLIHRGGPLPSRLCEEVN